MKGIFDGIRVLDFTAHVSGPAATSALADLGAEVVKIEPPEHGDDTRRLFPKMDGQALTFLWNNRGKKSVTINMKDPKGLEVVKKLIQTADVLVENFRPGVMKKFGLDYDSVKADAPGLVYCSISAFGQYGPDSARPGFDIIVQAKSGIMDLTGEPDGTPTKIGIVMGDMVSSKDAFGAICAGLYHKLKTGEGQYIDISMLECMTAMNLYVDHALMGKDPQRQGRHHISLAPYGIFKGKNGQCIVLAAFIDKHWAILCNDVFKQPGMITDPKYATGAARIENHLEIAAKIEVWLKQFDDINDALLYLDKCGIVCCKINSTKEAAQDPQLLAHGGIAEIEAMPSMKSTKTFRARGPWVKYSRTPAVMKRAPELGEHNYEIMEEAGLNKEEVEALQVKWKN